FAVLFRDETKTSNDQNQSPFGGGFRFNRGGPGGFNPFGGGGGRNNNPTQNTGESERAKKKGRVMAVADQRTSSLIVSAAAEMMPQIAEMIAQLDSSPARKQKVFVYDLQNADPQQVEQVVKGLFERTTTSANSRK